MSNSKLAIAGLLNAIGVLLYTALVSWILYNGNRLFGSEDNVFSLIAILLLFVLSAAIVGALIFVRPIILYINGLKSSAIRLFFFTVAWLVVFAIAVFAFLLWKP